MQEDIEHRSVTLVMRGAKLTGRFLKWAMQKALAQMKKQKSAKAHAIPHGKQSVKKLVGQNQGVSNMPVTDKNIGSFERVARKYGVDFAVKKDKNTVPPTFYVFFKARDADALTSAFNEYSAKKIKKAERPSVRERLRKPKAVSHSKPEHRERKKKQEHSR